MKSICFFASYFPGDDLPYYIGAYLQELKKHFSELVLLTSGNALSTSALGFLKSENITWQPEKNEGFDFGLWFKAFQQHNIEAYDRIALVNDSCILFKPLDEFIEWAERKDATFLGMTRSEAIAPHLQSYFLYLKKPAISLVKDYFEQHRVLGSIREVILTYEVGLSTFLKSKAIKMAAFVDNNGYSGEFSPYYHCVDYHLSKGVPLIKKKIIYSSYRKDELFTLARMNFKLSPKRYISQIKKNNSSVLIDFDRINADVTGLSALSQLKYNISRMLIYFLRVFFKKN